MQLLKIPLPSRLEEFLLFAFWVYVLDCSVRNHSWAGGGFVGGSCLAVASPGCSAWVGVAGCGVCLTSFLSPVLVSVVFSLAFLHFFALISGYAGMNNFVGSLFLYLFFKDLHHRDLHP